MLVDPQRNGACRKRRLRLAIFATHPVQYHTALWRALASTPGLDVHVHYFSDQSVRGGVDPGFGVPVAWDVPLLTGYAHTFLSRNIDISRFWSATATNLRQVLSEGAFDWVYVQSYTYPFERQVIRSAKALRMKTLMRAEFADIHRRNWVKNAARDLYLRWFYRYIDVFCFPGETARLHLIRRGIEDRRLFFSPYSVDSDLFRRQDASSDRAECRDSIGLGEGHFTFIFSGKFIPRKEPLLLLDAIRRLPERSSVALVMLGDGPLKKQVMVEGEALLGERFIAPGFVNQSGLGRYFAAADAHVLPSNFETWGLVVNEAMHFGLPSVVSDRVGCHPDLVQDGETGYVFGSGDPAHLSKTLLRLINNNEEAAVMGSKARALVKGYSVEAAQAGVLSALGHTYG